MDLELIELINKLSENIKSSDVYKTLLASEKETIGTLCVGQ